MVVDIFGQFSETNLAARGQKNLATLHPLSTMAIKLLQKWRITTLIYPPAHRATGESPPPSFVERTPFWKIISPLAHTIFPNLRWFFPSPKKKKRRIVYFYYLSPPTTFWRNTSIKNLELVLNLCTRVCVCVCTLVCVRVCCVCVHSWKTSSRLPSEAPQNPLKVPEKFLCLWFRNLWQKTFFFSSACTHWLTFIVTCVRTQVCVCV